MFVKEILYRSGNSAPKAGFASKGNIRPMEYVNMTHTHTHDQVEHVVIFSWNHFQLMMSCSIVF